MNKLLVSIVFVSFLFTACSKDSEVGNDLQNTIQILVIGNSYSQDAFAYVPFIIKNLNIAVDVRIGILMKSDSVLADHISNFESKSPVYSFYYFNGGSSWEKKLFKTIQWALKHYQWDIIVTHQSSWTENDWESRYQPFLDLFVKQVQSSIEHPVRFAWMLSQARPAQTNNGPNWSDDVILSHFDFNAKDSRKIVEESKFDMVIPVGTAIQNARTVSRLTAMGDYSKNLNNNSGKGYLCAFDGIHLQEGLPCQIAAYTVIVSVLNILGFDEQIICNDESIITKNWLLNKFIPGQHGDPIGSSEENCKIAHICAIMANKSPFEIMDISKML